MKQVEVILDLEGLWYTINQVYREQADYSLVNEMTGQEIHFEVDKPTIGAVTITALDNGWGDEYA